MIALSDTSYLVEAGIIANEAPLNALEHGLHFWVIRGLWQAKDPASVINQGAIVLDDESVVKIDGPYCLFCELDYNPSVGNARPRECPGVEAAAA